MADSALTTFTTGMERARYLVKLYHGLTNTRQRSIRSDWAESFCNLMHWPQSASIERVDSNDVIVVIRDGASLASADFAHVALADLLRASLVMGVSAMDAYFHSKILAYVVKAARKGENMPKALLRAGITVSDFVSASKYKRRMQALRNAMQRSLSFQSFQQAKNIEDALGLIGIAKFWSSTATRMARTPDDLKAELALQVKRRNQIAHEGDLSQSKKSRNKSRDITPKQVFDALRFLDGLVTHAEAEINQQLTALGLA